MSDSDPFALMDYLIDQFNKKGLAFLEVNEGLAMDRTDAEKREVFWRGHEKKTIRENFKHKFNGAFISNYQLTFESGTQIVE